MRNTVTELWNDKNYIKWRKENPSGGKPIKYNHLKFRSIQEASLHLKISRPTIRRHINQNKNGCKLLNINKKHNFLIKY